MQVDIITPDQNLFSGEAESISVPGSDGSFGVLNNHAPLIASLKAGNIVLIAGGQEQTFDVKGGVIEVNNNKVIVLAE